MSFYCHDLETARSSGCRKGTCAGIEIACLLSGYFVVCSVHKLCLIGLMMTLYSTWLDIRTSCFCSLARTTRGLSPDLILSVLNDSTGRKWSSRSVPKSLSVLSSLPNVARAKAWPASLRTDDYDQFNNSVDRACRAFIVLNPRSLVWTTSQRRIQWSCTQMRRYRQATAL
jgi:hypothetical protein